MEFLHSTFPPTPSFLESLSFFSYSVFSLAQVDVVIKQKAACMETDVNGRRPGKETKQRKKSWSWKRVNYAHQPTNSIVHLPGEEEVNLPMSCDESNVLMSTLS